MKRRTTRYGLPVVERIELSEKHFPVRTVMVIAGIVVALGALAYAVLSLFSVSVGWREIESDGSQGVNCGDDFAFMAEIGVSGVSPAAEVKRLTALYTAATARAYRVFDVVQGHDGVNGLHHLNAHPGEDVRVEPELYAALKRACASRYLFLAPIYEVNRSLFACENDYDAASFDPAGDAELMDFFRRAAAFARDEAMVDIEFFENDTVRLNVAPAYAAFAADFGVTVFVDLGWMKNAFIADYLAEEIAASGFTAGTISSRDGFTRCLDARDTTYALDLFIRQDGRTVQAGRLGYRGPMALAALRRFPAPGDARRFYVFSDGRVASPYADLSDGLDRAALPTLIGCARDMGCGELAMALAPVYVAEAFDEDAARALADEGVALACGFGDRFECLDAGLPVALEVG